MSEHIAYVDKNLHIHLCLLFNSLIRHCFLPRDFCVGLIIPLLKDKHVDASLVNMYRGITLSSALSKLFEYIVLELCGECLESDTMQYGFKKGSRCVVVCSHFENLFDILHLDVVRCFCASLLCVTSSPAQLHTTGG